MFSRRWLFIASCTALVTSAFTFMVRAEVMQDVRIFYQLSQEQIGAVEGTVFLGMAASMLLGGFICDLLGMRLILVLAFLSHLSGVLGTIYASEIATFLGVADISSPEGVLGIFKILAVCAFLTGCGNGMTEVAINPLAAALYPHQKTHYLNVLHAWWPGGLILAGIFVKLAHGGPYGLNFGFVAFDGFGQSWQTCMWLILIPCFAYGAMVAILKFPVTERVAVGVSTKDMVRDVFRPLFFLWALCIVMTAATELGPQKWLESILIRLTSGEVSGTLVLVYTSGIMFVLRHFAGPLAHAISPVGMLVVSMLLSAVGLYMLSFADSAATAFGYATIFGFGIAFVWPTMLGFVAERFPKGGALALALIGSAGNLGVFVSQTYIGTINDQVTERQLPEEVRLAASIEEQKRTKYDPGKLSGIVSDLAVLRLSQGMLDPDLPTAIANRVVTRSAEGTRTLNAEAVATLPPEAFSKDIAENAALFPADRPDWPAIEQKLIAHLPVALQQVIAPQGKLDSEVLTSLAYKIREAQINAAATSFRLVSLLPTILVVIFSAVWVWDYSRGGYKAIVLTDAPTEA